MTQERLAGWEGEVVVTQGFWKNVDRRAPDKCWPWIGPMGSTGAGYGRMHVNGKQRPATHISWEIRHRKPFPAGKVACHSCDNSVCVNPAHIWAGTQSENILDCVAKGRHASRPMQQCQRGHQMTPDNRAPTKGGFRCRECAREGTKQRMRKMRQRRKSDV